MNDIYTARLKQKDH